jgi:hypothetical protein
MLLDFSMPRGRWVAGSSPAMTTFLLLREGDDLDFDAAVFGAAG